MAKLYPPIIEGILPAFWDQQIEVPFTMNRAVGVNDYDKITIAIKNVVSGSIIETQTTQDKPTDGKAIFNLEGSYAVGQYYKIQLAYQNGTEIGYYSTVGIAKYTATPIDPTIECDPSGRCTGTYTIPENDKLEKLYSYEFNLKDQNNNLKASSGVQIHDTSSDSGDGTQSDFWTLPMTPEANDKLTYSIKTMNGVEKTIELDPEDLPVPVGNTVDHDLKALLSAQMDNDSGSVVLRIKCRPKNVYTTPVDSVNEATAEALHLTGSFVLLRKTNINNQWQEIERFNIDQELNPQQPIDLWIDYTLEAGVEYTYALQFYNNANAYSTPILNYEGPQVADFYDAFLYDGERQLRICYNPRVSSFKTVKMESKVNTIGGNYPFIFRNGNTNYKEFSIGGLLSFNGDEQYKFRQGAKIGVARPDARTRSRTEAIDNIENSNTTNLTSANFKLEREFKLQVLDWLNNGKPKLFRSPGEGNYIVQLMNTSLTPTDSLGRMIHSFNTSATEIMDYTWNNLNDLGYMELNVASSNTIIDGNFDAPHPDTVYYGPSTATTISCPDITTDQVESLGLTAANITEVQLRPLPLYTIKYTYEQYPQTLIIDGKEVIVWKAREVCHNLAARDLMRQGVQGIYYIYNEWSSYLEYKAMTKVEASTFTSLSRGVNYTFNTVSNLRVNGITDVDYNYQINMTKYPSIRYNATLNNQEVYPYTTGHLEEDIYAIHIGNGLIANIIYEPYIGG